MAVNELIPTPLDNDSQYARFYHILIPDPLDNDSQYARFYHLDIATLDDTELLDELYALRPILWGLAPDNWLRERVKLIQTELAKRKYDRQQQGVKR